MPGRVVGSRVALVPMLALALSAACSAVPAATSPAASPQQSPSPGLTPTSTAASPTAGTSPTPTGSQTTHTSTPSPTASPSVAPTVAPTPTATVAGQVEPVPLGKIDGGLSMVVDPDGFVHAAFVRNGRIQYLTNTNGAWTRQAVTTPEGEDGQPSIALDTDGSVWIAFTRWEACPVDEEPCFPPPLGIFLITNSAGAWSTAQQVEPGWIALPSLAVRDGQVHLTYLAGQACGFEPCGPSDLHYATNSSGSWVDDEIGLTLGGPAPLELTSDGSVYVAYVDVGAWPAEWDTNMGSHVTRIAIARGDGPSSLTSEPVYEQIGGFVESVVLTALDGADRVHVVADMGGLDDIATRVYLTGRDGSWSEEASAPPVGLRAAAADAAGSLHVLVATPDCCLQYVTNRSGAFEGGWSLADGPGVIDVDQQGRAHILFVTTGDNGDSLWYTLGPTV